MRAKHFGMSKIFGLFTRVALQAFDTCKYCLFYLEKAAAKARLDMGIENKCNLQIYFLFCHTIPFNVTVILCAAFLLTTAMLFLWTTKKSILLMSSCYWNWVTCFVKCKPSQNCNQYTFISWKELNQNGPELLFLKVKCGNWMCKDNVR